jgi:hypothetical protein
MLTRSISGSRDIVVGIATGFGLDHREVGVRVPVGLRIFISPSPPDRLWGHPTSYTMGTWSSFPGVKRPGREADHSPPTSAEVKKMWTLQPLTHKPSWASAYLVKHRDNFTFTLRSILVRQADTAIVTIFAVVIFVDFCFRQSSF